MAFCFAQDSVNKNSALILEDVAGINRKFSIAEYNRPKNSPRPLPDRGADQ